MTDDSPAYVQVPALMTTTHVAQVLDCSVWTVRRRIAEGALPAVTENGRLMVRGDDLRRYVYDLERFVPNRPARKRRAKPIQDEFAFLDQ